MTDPLDLFLAHLLECLKRFEADERYQTRAEAIRRALAQILEKIDDQ